MWICDDYSHRIDCKHESLTLEIEHVIRFVLVVLIYPLLEMSSELPICRLYDRPCNGIGTFWASTRIFFFIGWFLANIWISFASEKLPPTALTLSPIQRHILFVVGECGAHKCTCYRRRKFMQSLYSSCMHLNQKFMTGTIDFKTNDIKLITFQPVLKCTIYQSVARQAKFNVGNTLFLLKWY